VYNGYISGCWLPIFTYIYHPLPIYRELPFDTQAIEGKIWGKNIYSGQICMPFRGNFPVNEPKLRDFTIGYTWALNNKDISKTSRGRAWNEVLKNVARIKRRYRLAIQSGNGNPQFRDWMRLVWNYVQFTSSVFVLDSLSFLVKSQLVQLLGTSPSPTSPVAETFPVGSHSEFGLVKLFTFLRVNLWWWSLFLSKKLIGRGCDHGE
jgi:hypothetical protein